jgi:hypothetical protein
LRTDRANARIAAVMLLRPASFASRLRPIALAALTVLVLGAAGHLWHHVVDADCDDPRGGMSHPCTSCVSLHASALAEDTPCGCAPTFLPRHPVLVAESPVPAAAALCHGPARGPPLA